MLGRIVMITKYRWEELQEIGFRYEHEESLRSMKMKILAQVKVRWETVRVRDDFEELVLSRPEFGRDVLRIV